MTNNSSQEWTLGYGSGLVAFNKDINSFATYSDKDDEDFCSMFLKIQLFLSDRFTIPWFAVGGLTRIKVRLYKLMISR